MSNSKLAAYTNLSPNKTSPRTHSIDTITIHCIVGQWTAKRGCDYFADGKVQASANYVVGRDGSVGLCVEEKDRSWCSSNAANDHRAVTIEVASDTAHPYAVTDAAYSALIGLVADICRRNGIEKLVWSEKKTDRVNHVGGCNMTVHRDFANKACPGDYLYSRHADIAAKVNAMLGETGAQEYTLPQFIRDVQTATGAKVDGIAGPETLSKTVTLSAGKNRAHAAVKPVQKRLCALGYTQVGEADGIAGPKFTAAVKAYQKDNGCWADGEITARNMTWKKLLGMA